jgi:hypothetical protein
MMTRLNMTFIDEPCVEFNLGQKAMLPHDGLSLFGPYSSSLPSHPSNITYGIIGTNHGLNVFRNWSDLMNGPTFTDSGKSERLWPPFPGFEATYHSKWPVDPVWKYEIDVTELLAASRVYDPNQRASAVVEYYLNAIQTAKKKDEVFDIFICVVPDEVWLNCRPLSTISDGVGRKISAKELKFRRRGQTNLFEDYDISIYQHSVDFRRQLKARAMIYDIPIQIIRESTLYKQAIQNIRRDLTPLSDRMWNLSNAIYYKAGGKPWRLWSAREGVCYIGIAYKRTDADFDSRTACCAAQMFLDSGDGIVFLGEYGPWFSPKSKECHLSADAAYNLLSGVLKTYDELEGRTLNEVFLHCRSELDNEEFRGFKKACPKGVNLVGIRVKPEKFGIRAFRHEVWPIIRGSVLILNNRSCILWTTGFKPSILTYDGWELPMPLKIDIQFGDATIRQVATDILALTKLNYNTCKLGDSQPVTVGFSARVGEILVANPNVKKVSPKFKFYI